MNNNIPKIICSSKNFNKTFSKELGEYRFSKSVHFKIILFSVMFFKFNIKFLFNINN